MWKDAYAYAKKVEKKIKKYLITASVTILMIQTLIDAYWCHMSYLVICCFHYLHDT